MSFGVISDRITVDTRGNGQVLDLTGLVADKIGEHSLVDGQVLVFVPGSTAAVTTIEFEPGLVRDLPEMFERLAPREIGYRHDDTWRDGNGHSHVRASLLGPSLVVPVTQGEMALGTWQQVALVDFDTRPRRRQVVVQIIGEIDATRRR